SIVVAASVCYLISNGSYYWLGSHWLAASGATRSLAGWGKNLGDWYLSFVGMALVYVAVAAVLHVLAMQPLRALPARAGNRQRRRSKASFTPTTGPTIRWAIAFPRSTRAPATASRDLTRD